MVSFAKKLTVLYFMIDIVKLYTDMSLKAARLFNFYALL